MIDVVEVQEPKCVFGLSELDTHSEGYGVRHATRQYAPLRGVRY